MPNDSYDQLHVRGVTKIKQTIITKAKSRVCHPDYAQSSLTGDQTEECKYVCLDP